MGESTRKTTEDGFETVFGVNHLGHFLLTNLLLQKIIESKGRIVNLSSGLHKRGVVDFNDLQSEKNSKWDSFQIYSNSKLANVYFTIELQKRLQGTGVDVFAVHPGVISTDLSRNSNGFTIAMFKLALSVIGKTPLQGCQTTLFAAISPSLKGKGGSYLGDCEIQQPNPTALVPENTKRLWDISWKLVS